MFPFRSKYAHATVKPHHYSVFYNSASGLDPMSWHRLLTEKLPGQDDDTYIGSILHEYGMIVVTFGCWDVYFCFGSSGKNEDLPYTLEFWLDSDWDEDLLSLEPEDFPEINVILDCIKTFDPVSVIRHHS